MLSFRTSKSLKFGYGSGLINFNLVCAVLLIPLAMVYADKPKSDTIYNVKGFGAKGDGIHLDTESIQEAIRVCHEQGGGIVVLPRGRYNVGTLELLSNVTLRLRRGAVLMGSQRIEDYADHVSGLAEEPAFQKCLIHAKNANGIAFEGDGLVDGRGSGLASLVKAKKKSRERPMLIRLVDCQNVRFSGLHFRNPASWGLHLVGCQNVQFKGITMISRNNKVKNNDGIDLDGCRDVTVENCRINSGDDAICLKSTIPQPCSNIVVKNCQLSSKTAGFKLGTSSRSGFVNIRLTDSEFHDCPMGCIKLLLVDGGRLENVRLERLVMKNVGGPIFIRLGNRGRIYDRPSAQIYGKDVLPEGAPVGIVRNILIKQVTARVSGKSLDRQGIMITGIPGHRVEDITLEDIKIRFPGGATRSDFSSQVPEDIARYPEQYFFGVLPAWGIFVRHADGIRVRNINFCSDAKDTRPPVFLEDVSNWNQCDVVINGRKTNLQTPVTEIKLFDMPHQQK